MRENNGTGCLVKKSTRANDFIGSGLQPKDILI